MTLEMVAAIWIACGIAGSVLIAIWWTDELPLTTSEIPGLLFGVIIGPINLGVGLVFIAGVVFKYTVQRLFPNSRRVILRQWGRW